jgi:hypothetical protein
MLSSIKLMIFCRVALVMDTVHACTSCSRTGSNGSRHGAEGPKNKRTISVVCAPSMRVCAADPVGASAHVPLRMAR